MWCSGEATCPKAECRAGGCVQEREHLVPGPEGVDTPVYVSNDPTEREHVLSKDCWCGPTVETVTEPAEEDDSSQGKVIEALVDGLKRGVEFEEKAMRVFESGATRNVEVDPDYHGFLSPLALHAYGEYMHRHRLQADGTMRDSDNWQKGIPNDAFVRSLVRHVHDIQLVFDGYGELARQDDRDDNVLLAHLSAALFNVQGMLHNVMLSLLEGEREAQFIASVVAEMEAEAREGNPT